jgi:hypothetical protein
MRFKEVYGSASGRVSRGAQAGFESQILGRKLGRS